MGSGGAAAGQPALLSWGLLLEAHPLAHFVYDTDSLRLLAVNEAALARYGYSREEFLAMRRDALLLPQELPALRAFLAALPGSAVAEHQHVWLERTRDGRVLHADVRGMPVLLDGRLVRLAAVVDAGARTQLAADAALARDLLEVAGRMAQLGGWSIDLVQQRVHWSDQVCAIHEVPPGTEYSLEAAIAFYPGAAAARIADAVQACVAEGTPYDLELPLVSARGNARVVRVTGAAMRDASGHIVGIEGAQQDVTQRVQLERRFHAMADAAPVGIYMTDPTGSCTYTNPAWQRLYGLSFDASLGRAWIKIVHPDDRPWVRQRIVESSGAPLELEFRLCPDADTVRTVSARANPIVRGDGEITGHVGTVVDVTQARELEAALRARAVAEEAGRRQTAFLSRMSHELRTPLNAILGFGQLLQRAPDGDPERTQAYANQVVHAGQHMLALVDDLLELQRLEQHCLQLQREPVTLQPLLMACAEQLRPLTEAAGGEVVVAAAPGLVVHSDAQCLRQIVLNLASNAVKYGAGIGAPCRVVLAAEDMAGGVQLTVADQGVGMDAAQVQRLFRPFERLGRQNGAQAGTGLGLVITRQLAELLGAEIALSSEPGRGTVATVRLPG